MLRNSDTHFGAAKNKCFDTSLTNVVSCYRSSFKVVQTQASIALYDLSEKIYDYMRSDAR